MKKFISDIVNLYEKEFNIATGIVIEFQDNYLFSIQNKEKWRKENNINNIGLVGIGGGVEQNETILQNIDRECLEEIGRTVRLKEEDSTIYIDENNNISQIKIKKNKYFPSPYAITKIKNNKSYNNFLYTIVLSYRSTLDTLPNILDISGLVLIRKETLVRINSNGMPYEDWVELGVEFLSKDPMPINSKLIPFGTFRSFINLKKISKKRN